MAALRSTFGFGLSLAAAWLLCATLAEAFVAWYSGTEVELELQGWIHLGLQAVVDLAACVLGWRIGCSAVRDRLTRV